MKRFLKWSGIFALGALLPMLMAPSGGFPFFPTFGKVTVTTVNGSPEVALNVTSGTNSPLIAFQAAGVEKVALGSVGGAGGICTGSVAGDACMRVGGSHAFRLSGDGGTTSEIVLSGVQGNFGVNASTCVNGGSSGFGTCVRNSAGSYTATFSTVFRSAPNCVAVMGPGTAGWVEMSGVQSTSTATFLTVNTSGVATDFTTQVNVICLL